MIRGNPFFTVTFVAACLAVAPSAAAGPGTTSLTRVALSTIQQVRIGDAPKPTVNPPSPTKVEAKESVDGVQVTKDEGTIVTVIGLPGAASGSACIGREGPGALVDRLGIDVSEKVVRMRIERLVETQGAASFVRERFVVDTRTRGAKSLGIETVALTVVAVGDGSIYAYRDAVNVHVFWPATESVRGRDALGLVSSGKCGHGHVVLDANDVNGPKSSAIAASSGASSEGNKTTLRYFGLTASVTKSSVDKEPFVSIGVSRREERRTAQSFPSTPPPSDLAMMKRVSFGF